MSTTSTVPTEAPAGRTAHGVDRTALALTAPRVLRAELLKLVTLRSSVVSLAALLAVVTGVGAIASFSVDATGLTARGAVDVTLVGAGFAVLLAAAFGAVAGAREFGSGMVRTTVAAVPRRAELVVAKATALVTLVLPVSLAGTFGAFLAGSAVLGSRGLAVPALADPGVLRAVVGTALYLTGLSVIGLAVGVLVRSTAGAVATVLGAVLILPTIAGQLLPERWSHLLEVLPSAAGEAITTSGPSDHLLSPLAGGADFLGWVVLGLALAALALRYRDA